MVCVNVANVGASMWPACRVTLFGFAALTSSACVGCGLRTFWMCYTFLMLISWWWSTVINGHPDLHSRGVFDWADREVWWYLCWVMQSKQLSWCVAAAVTFHFTARCMLKYYLLKFIFLPLRSIHVQWHSWMIGSWRISGGWWWCTNRMGRWVLRHLSPCTHTTACCMTAGHACAACAACAWASGQSGSVCSLACDDS